MVIVPGPELADAGRALGVAWSDSGYFDVFDNGRPPADLPPKGHPSSLVVNPQGNGWRRPEVAVSGTTLVLEGKRYDLKRYDLVYATTCPDAPWVVDLVLHTTGPERLGRLAERLGHYGRYSWLLLPVGPGRVLRGNWEPSGSPLVAGAP